MCIAGPIDVCHTADANGIFTKRLIPDYRGAHAIMTVRGYRTYVGITCIGCLAGRDWDFYRPLAVEGIWSIRARIHGSRMAGNQIPVFVNSYETPESKYAGIENVAYGNNVRFNIFICRLLNVISKFRA